MNASAIGIRSCCPRIRHILATTIAVAGVVALGALPGASSLVRDAYARQAAPLAAPSVVLHGLASGTASLPATGTEFVWLVQRDALSGDQRREVSAFPLGFAFAQRGALSVLGADGGRIATLDPGQAVFLPSGVGGAYTSVTGDLALYLQIALVPITSVPSPPPTRVSEPFAITTPGAALLTLELARGMLNPGRESAVPAAETPSLLLATDSDLRVETGGAPPVDVPRDEIALLADTATVRNDGQQLLTFLAVRVAPPPADRTTMTAAEEPAPLLHPLDPTIDEAWRRHGCHLNSGNAACLTVGLAAECAANPSDPGCRSDGDGDSCADVAEVRAGFDPLDPTDCIGGGHGEPAVNCLFPGEDVACDGLGQLPPDDCVLLRRDPQCDGFAPDGG